MASQADSEIANGLSEADWSSIRGAYEAGRHAVHAIDAGYEARNPGQQWVTQFDGRGFSTRPDTGAWSWGLELIRYGFAGQERTVSKPDKVSANGQHVTYDWDSALQEWYVNDSRGLEHGYTVHERPTRATGCVEYPLSFTLAVRGELTAQVQPGGRGVRFVNSEGILELTYAGLIVLDSDGQQLNASFARIVEGLLISVDDRGARYPLTIDPIAQQVYLKASNTDAGDQFGCSVAISGDTVVVGAVWEDGVSTGVNGNQSNNNATESGAAYVFVRNGAGWSQQAYLKASNTAALDYFGVSVAVSGNTVVVGASGEDSSATGVNGDQSNNTIENSGAAYVFVRSGSTWSQQAYLKASNTGANDAFGESVAVSGDTVLVASSREESNATGVNGDQLNNGLSQAGAAYVFVRSGATWSQQAYLKSSNTGGGDEFGVSVSVSGDTVVVGAHGEDSNATGVNGDQSNNSFSGAGAAYVFVRGGTTWSQEAFLKPSNTGSTDQFGESVAVSGDTVVVGAKGEDSNATGVNGDQGNNSFGSAGAAYVFVRSGTSWSQQAYLKASNTGGGDGFGKSVAVSGDTVIVSAQGESSNSSGMNGDQWNDNLPASGAAYIFLRSGTIWSQQAYLKASNTGDHDGFGKSVAASGDTVVVGAADEDSNAIGLGGNQMNNLADRSGASYVVDFDADVGRWTDVGGGTVGSNGPPTLVGTGSLVGDTQASVQLSQAPPLAFMLAWLSFTSEPVSFFGGVIHANPVTKQFLLFADPSGGITLSTTWPLGLSVGTEVWFQFLVQDVSVVWGITLSNAVKATTP